MMAVNGTDDLVAEIHGILDDHVGDPRIEHVEDFATYPDAKISALKTITACQSGELRLRIRDPLGNLRWYKVTMEEFDPTKRPADMPRPQGPLMPLSR